MEIIRQAIMTTPVRYISDMEFHFHEYKQEHESLSYKCAPKGIAITIIIQKSADLVHQQQLVIFLEISIIRHLHNQVFSNHPSLKNGMMSISERMV